MEIEKGTANLKLLGAQRKNLQKQLRDIDKLTSMEPEVRESQKEEFMCLLQLFERKWTDLLPEHQKMQRRSQKLQSLQDKKKHHIMEACAREDELQRVSEDMANMQARFQALSENSVIVGGLQARWKKKFRSYGQGRKGEAAVRRNPMDVALIQPCGSRSSHVEQHRRNTLSNPCSQSSTEGSKLQTLWSKGQKEKGKKIGMTRRRPMGGMKALRWVLLCNLLGARKIPARQEIGTGRMW